MERSIQSHLLWWILWKFGSNLCYMLLKTQLVVLSTTNSFPDKQQSSVLYIKCSGGKKLAHYFFFCNTFSCKLTVVGLPRSRFCFSGAHVGSFILVLLCVLFVHCVFLCVTETPERRRWVNTTWGNMPSPQEGSSEYLCSFDGSKLWTILFQNRL